ncbi:MAG: polyhydroxyalkanoate synthesis regulator DNA-binding domain-containing protein [Chloroflexota bacterium]|nr:polyhydroxyalkanoate synthesis regulator DNA-binding domain-containing protein [Chloroflexota bacterium]
MTTVLIKRYPNRKLYNTEAKRYVTLNSIAELIREGDDVEVRDHETGEDLTGITLSQIIFEREKKGKGFLPDALLTNLIRTGGDTLSYVRHSFQASIGAIRTLEIEFDRRIDSLVRRGELGEQEAQELREEMRETVAWDSVDSSALDTRVETTLHRLNMPSRVDLLRLQAQVDQLTKVLDAMLDEERQASVPNSLRQPPADG